MGDPFGPRPMGREALIPRIMKCEQLPLHLRHGDTGVSLPFSSPLPHSSLIAGRACSPGASPANPTGRGDGRVPTSGSAGPIRAGIGLSLGLASGSSSSSCSSSSSRSSIRSSPYSSAVTALQRATSSTVDIPRPAAGGSVDDLHASSSAAKPGSSFPQALVPFHL